MDDNKAEHQNDSMCGTKRAEEQFRSISVTRFFTSELTRGYLLEKQEEKYARKRQRVYTFMKTPRELEKFCIYGFFQCLDAFLFVFTFLPIRIVLAIVKVFTMPCGLMRSRNLWEPAQICDILKGIILVVCSFIMMHIDTSMMYHLVRGQATIKLYVFFNMLDMADRLLSNFGHDILDALFWTATEPRDRKRDHLGTLSHLIIAIIYVIMHTMLILFQATVLNVAFNSHNKSLLVIMMSNNFVEIKGSLFRKVDMNHLYQISCSDVKERFHYVILLSLVCVRNMTQVNWNTDHLWVLLPDAIMVLISEVFVDWGKHAFILKFNEIGAEVYHDFKVKLALDMASSRQSQAFTDHSDLVSRRMGLTPLPLSCLLFQTLSKSIKLTTWMSYLILLILFLCLVSFKVLNSIVLLGHSYTVILNNHDQMEKENEDQKNNETEKAKESKECSNSQDEPLQKEVTKPVLERSSSCDLTQVTRVSSQIFAADSYTELTMLPNSTVIESLGGITMTASPKKSSNNVNLCEANLQQGDHIDKQFETEISPQDSENETCETIRYSHETAIPSTNEGVVNRLEKNYFMNFDMPKAKFGSSSSLPEMGGRQEERIKESAGTETKLDEKEEGQPSSPRHEKGE